MSRKATKIWLEYPQFNVPPLQNATFPPMACGFDSQCFILTLRHVLSRIIDYRYDSNL